MTAHNPDASPYLHLSQSPIPRPPSLTDLAYARIRDALLLGELAPGDVLSVVKLANALDMSRSPVRAAAERIAAEGLLVQRGSNLLVRQMRRQDLLDALQVRGPLESLATTLATPLLDAGVLQRLEDIHEGFARAVSADNTTVARRADLEFHQTVQERSQNPVLIEHLERLQAQVILATYSAAWGASQHQAVEEHRAILDCLNAKDSSAAGLAALHHVEAARSRVTTEWPESTPSGD
ncbi:MAG: mcbR 1 [Nocardioides sp.]|uniref:GntR family transcriptional regulator n=1 Tax=Nocardioides sp. TaxID=35761 RepID=UPI00261EB165|nr:GntR family transcriptional regulator [Nocardioides sp.]MCW2833520.1 mcbR 1 [Nocardioides sp.]